MTLTPQEKNVWNLKHLKCREIAKILGMKPETVGKYMQRAKKKQKHETESISFLSNNPPDKTPLLTKDICEHNAHRQDTKTNSAKYMTECQQAIQDIALGLPHLQRFVGIQRSPITALNPSAPFVEAKDRERLTPREQEIWLMEKNGKKRSEIASELQICSKTVERRLQIIRKKLQRDFIPQASVAELTAAAEVAGISGKSLWKDRAKRLKILTKPRDHVVLRVTKEQRKDPDTAKALKGLSSIRTNLEGDAEYIIPKSTLDEIQATLVAKKMSHSMA